MKKIFLFICVIIFLFNTRYSFGEEKTKEKYGINIDVQQDKYDEKLEIILFKKQIETIERLAEKLTGANSVSADSIEYTILSSSKDERNLKLKILRYSFLRLEYSIFFH